MTAFLRFSHQVFGIVAQLCPFQAVTSTEVQEDTVFPRRIQTSLTSGLETDRQAAETRMCADKKINFLKRNGRGATVWKPGRGSPEVQVLSHHLPTEARPQTLQNIALNKALNGFTQPLPARQFLPKKGQNVVEIHFTLFKD